VILVNLETFWGIQMHLASFWTWVRVGDDVCLGFCFLIFFVAHAILQQIKILITKEDATIFTTL